MYRHAFLVAVAALAGACSNLVPLSRVAAAEAMWQSRGPQNYDFVFEIEALMRFTECSPGRGIEVEVREGRTVKFGTCDVDSELARHYGSVPKLFATIRADRLEHPPRYLVQFNSSLGYPESIDANFSRTMTDHNFWFNVENFREIQ